MPKCDVCQCETPPEHLTLVGDEEVCDKPLCRYDWRCVTHDVCPDIAAKGRADLIAQGHTEGGYPDAD